MIPNDRKKDLQRFYTTHVGENVHCIIIQANQALYRCNVNELYDALVSGYGTGTAEAMMYHDSFFASEDLVREIAHTAWVLTTAGSLLKLK